MYSLMGNCISWLKKKKTPARKLTVAILGLDNAGKTVTAKGLLGEANETVAPTIGFSSVDFKFEKFDISMYDLGGGKRIRDIWKTYLYEIYGLVYVVDSSDADRLSEARKVLQELLEHKNVTGKPLLLLANKQDKEGAMDEIDVCEALRLEELVNLNKTPCRVETCSASMGTGKKMDKSIQDGMKWLVTTIDESFDRLDTRVKADKKEQDEKNAQERQERIERVRKAKEERERERKAAQARGEIPLTDDEEDETQFSNKGDPFKRIDPEELKAKEAKLKEEKRLKKERENKAYASDGDDKGRVSLNRRKQKQNRLDSDDDSDDQPRLSRSFNRGRSSYNRMSEDDDSDSDKKQHSWRTPRASKRSESPEGRSRSLSPPRRRLAPLDSPRLANNDPFNRAPLGYDNEDDYLSKRSPWLKKKPTPRPGSPNGLPPSLPGLSSRHGGEEDNGGYDLGHRRTVAHLAPLEPLDGLDERKKKKKKKKVKRNQTVPSEDDDDEDAYNAHHERAPHARGWQTPPQAKRSMIKASRSPRLDTLQEPEDEESSFSQKWGLAEDLPVAVSEPRRFRPNMDSDEDIVT